MKLLKLYGYYFKINVKKLIEYPMDFTFNVISVFIWVGSGLLNIIIIFSDLETLKGWHLAEIGLLYGIWSLTFSLYNAFGSGILDLEETIITGKFDVLLTKPLSPLFQIISSRISSMGIGFFVFGIVMVIITTYNIAIEWHLWSILYLLLTIISGGLLIFSTYLIMGSLSFWFLRSNAVIRIGYDIHKFVQYPIDIYNKGIRVLLSTIVPYAFTNYFPVAFILGKVKLFWGIMSPIVSICIFLVSMFIWRLGIKKYEGSGS